MYKHANFAITDITFILISVYKDRLTMPKYIITSAGDEFFPPDDSHYYFNQMQGKTYIRYCQIRHLLSIRSISEFLFFLEVNLWYHGKIVACGHFGSQTIMTLVKNVVVHVEDAVTVIVLCNKNYISFYRVLQTYNH